MSRGVFVVFEGGDAGGKTTQARRLAERVGGVFTREPGGTDLGEVLRSLVLEPIHPVALRAEALLIAAARAQHVAEVIEPALASGRHVVCDRFVASSLVYQGAGSGLGVDAVAAINHFATAGLAPDLSILVQVPRPLARRRLGSQLDRFETEDEAFHERVAAAYAELVRADPAAWVCIDGSGTVDDVEARVHGAVAGLFDELDETATGSGR